MKKRKDWNEKFPYEKVQLEKSLPISKRTSPTSKKNQSISEKNVKGESKRDFKMIYVTTENVHFPAKTVLILDTFQN